MKKFKDLKIGDEIFVLEEDLDIYSFKVTGILQHKSSDNLIEIYLKGSEYPVLVSGDGTFHRLTGVKKWYFVSYEEVKQGRIAAREKAVEDLFRKAVGCMRKIKRMAPNNDELRKRVFNMFNMKEDGSKI